MNPVENPEEIIDQIADFFPLRDECREARVAVANAENALEAARARMAFVVDKMKKIQAATMGNADLAALVAAQPHDETLRKLLERAALGALKKSGATDQQIRDRLSAKWPPYNYSFNRTRALGGKDPAVWIDAGMNDEPLLKGKPLIDEVRRVLAIPMPGKPGKKDSPPRHEGTKGKNKQARTGAIPADGAKRTPAKKSKARATPTADRAKPVLDAAMREILREAGMEASAPYLASHRITSLESFDAFLRDGYWLAAIPTINSPEGARRLVDAVAKYRKKTAAGSGGEKPEEEVGSQKTEDRSRKLQMGAKPDAGGSRFLEVGDRVREVGGQRKLGEVVAIEESHMIIDWDGPMLPQRVPLTQHVERLEESKRSKARSPKREAPQKQAGGQKADAAEMFDDSAIDPTTIKVLLLRPDPAVLQVARRVGGRWCYDVDASIGQDAVLLEQRGSYPTRAEAIEEACLSLEMFANGVLANQKKLNGRRRDAARKILEAVERVRKAELEQEVGRQKSEDRSGVLGDEQYGFTVRAPRATHAQATDAKSKPNGAPGVPPALVLPADPHPHAPAPVGGADA